jgi:peptidoglycan hydrolase-like protein with peptidoglycan-binding domain
MKMWQGVWQPDGAHQNAAFSVPYALTGDYFYLEEMQFWAAWSAALSNGASPDNCWWGRGPTGSYGTLRGGPEPRSDGWLLRNRAEVAFMSPDNSPEKNYFSTLMDDTIATWEGERNITNTPYAGTAAYNHGVNACLNGNSVGRWQGYGLSPLNFWQVDTTSVDARFLDTTKTSGVESPWMLNFLVYGLGRAKELGFGADRLLAWLGKNTIAQANPNTPGWDPYLAAAYRVGTIDKINNRWFQSWAEVKNAFLPQFKPPIGPNPSTYQQYFETHLSDPNHGYGYIAMGATSFLANEPGGADAWNWLKNQMLGDSLLSQNPQWAILPRSITSIPAPTSANPAFTTAVSGLSPKNEPSSLIADSTREGEAYNIGANVAPAILINNNISYGARGSDVISLQGFLAGQGYLSADSITGYFGPLTEAAVRAFQRNHDIVSSGDRFSTGYGVVGPLTRARINSLLRISSGIETAAAATNLGRAMSRGSRGDDVKVLQNFLAGRGYLQPIDELGGSNITGFFGVLTEAAVKLFQRAEGIVSSGDPASTGYGNVGPLTRAKINSMLNAAIEVAPTPSQGEEITSTSTAAEAVQIAPFTPLPIGLIQNQIDFIKKQTLDLLLKIQLLQ